MGHYLKLQPRADSFLQLNPNSGLAGRPHHMPETRLANKRATAQRLQKHPRSGDALWRL